MYNISILHDELSRVAEDNEKYNFVDGNIRDHFINGLKKNNFCVADELSLDDVKEIFDSENKVAIFPLPRLEKDWHKADYFRVEVERSEECLIIEVYDFVDYDRYGEKHSSLGYFVTDNKNHWMYK